MPGATPTSTSAATAVPANDDLIAGILNRNGLKTGNGTRWTRERVTSMRSNYRIPVFKPAEDGIEQWLNLSKAAKLLRDRVQALRLAAEAGEIESKITISPGRTIYLRSRCAHDISCPIDRRTGTTEPEIPRGIASRRTRCPPAEVCQLPDIVTVAPKIADAASDALTANWQPAPASRKPSCA